MKYLPSPDKDPSERLLVFEMDVREETLLLSLLRFYPVMENKHHRLSKDPKIATTAEQRLLEESMAQHQEAHRRKLDDLFHGPQRFFKEIQGERRLILVGDQLEWLLQVLNDIRVGSWVKLGCPDLEKEAPAAVAPADGRYLQAMHLSGQFQMAFLEAVK